MNTTTLEQIRVIPHVEAKIDYYTVLLYDCALGSFLKRFNVHGIESFENFILSAKDSMFLSMRVVIFKLPFGTIDIPVEELGHDAQFFRAGVTSTEEDEDDIALRSAAYERCYEIERLMKKRLSRVRFNVSGVQLDNMRALGFDPEEMFTSLDFWCSSFDVPGEDEEGCFCLFPAPPVANKFRVSRVDFAFDLVNDPVITGLYLENVLREFCGFKAAGIKRVSHGKPGGLAYDPQLGETIRCLYIGKGEKTIEKGTTSGSNEFLRIYDKKLEVGVKQYKMFDSNMWPDNEPHKGVKDWVRVELQCRNNVAEGFLFSLKDATPHQKFEVVMKHIADRYLVRPARDADVVKSLVEIFDVAVSENIVFIQLSTLPFRVPVRKDALQKSDDFLVKYSGQIDNLFARFGSDGLADKLNEIRLKLQSSQDVVDRRRFLYRNQNRVELAMSMGCEVSEFPGIDPDSGLLRKGTDYRESWIYPAMKKRDDEVLEQVAMDLSYDVSEPAREPAVLTLPG